MLYKSKANRIGVESLAVLGLRIIDTVNKSGLEDAKVSNQFLSFEEVNGRYQEAVSPNNLKQQKKAIDALFNERKALFEEIYVYLQGLLNSPEAEMKSAANLLFEKVNMYGKSFGRLKIADQSLRYIRIIESLKKPEFNAALAKTLLTAKISQLDQIQLNYEDLYMGLGNTQSEKTAPSNIRKEMQDALKLYIDEVRWMATRMNTEPWNTLYKNLEQRFEEVNVSTTRQKPKDNTSASTVSSTESVV